MKTNSQIVSNHRIGARLLLIALGLLLANVLVPVSAAQAGQAGNHDELASILFDEVIGNGSMALGDTLVSPQALILTPEGEFLGAEGLNEFLSILQRSFPDVTFVARHMIVEGDTVHVWWSMTGRHLGEYEGRAASCAVVAVNGESLLRIDDSRVAEVSFQYDQESLANQIDAFSQIDAGVRPTCAPDTDPALPPECGPDCLKPNGFR